MKKIHYLAFLFAVGCGQQNTAETVIVDSPKQDSPVELVPDSLPATQPSVPEAQIDFETISVRDNIVLSGVATYPFSKELYEIKSMLDSIGIESEFIDGENGGLSYDSADISCNRSYGETICEANVQSSLIKLSNGMKIGISMDNFLTLTGIKSNSRAQHARYEYSHSANEHTYTLRFDFINGKLIRFHYQKDPCVIYD